MNRIMLSEVPEALFPLIEIAIKAGKKVCLSTDRLTANLQSIHIFDGQYRIYLTDIGPDRRSGEYRFTIQEVRELTLLIW